MKTLSFLLPLNLQLFAEDPGAGGGEPGSQGGQGQGTQTGGQTGAQTGGQNATPPEGGDKQNQSGNQNPGQQQTKTPEEIQKELLASLGVDKLDDAKEALKAYKEYQDSQKTEAQKQAEQLQTLQDQLAKKDAEAATLNAKVAALSKGVRADAVDDVIKLVQGAEDLDKALDDVLKKYPAFGEGQTSTQNQQQQQKPRFGQSNYNGPSQQSELDKWLSAFGVKKSN